MDNKKEFKPFIPADKVMPEFTVACNNQPMILKWELENMLTFGSIPNKMNRIIIMRNCSDNHIV